MPEQPSTAAQAGADVEVAVLGGGPAGSAAAVTAARAGRSVLVVTDDGDRRFRIGEGAPPGLDRAVGSVFGREAFVADHHLPSYGNRSAWGSERAVDTDFVFNPFGHGWHLDRVAFDDDVLAATRTAGARLWSPATARVVAGSGDGAPWELVVRRGAEAHPVTARVTARVVVDATGRGAHVARSRGARLVTHGRLVAAVAVVGRPDGTTVDRDATTTVEATESGWWYTSAIPGGRRVVACCTDGDLVDPGLRTVEGFERRVAGTRLIRRVLDDLGPAATLGSPPRLVAAGTAHLDRPAGPGWVAAGDAAASFDPLSSQGILTAVLMGRSAGEAAVAMLDEPGTAAVDAHVAAYRDVVDRHLEELRRTYARERRWPHAPFWSRRHGDDARPAP